MELSEKTDDPDLINVGGVGYIRFEEHLRRLDDRDADRYARYQGQPLPAPELEPMTTADQAAQQAVVTHFAVDNVLSGADTARLDRAARPLILTGWKFSIDDDGETLFAERPEVKSISGNTLRPAMPLITIYEVSISGETDYCYSPPNYPEATPDVLREFAQINRIPVDRVEVYLREYEKGFAGAELVNVAGNQVTAHRNHVRLVIDRDGYIATLTRPAKRTEAPQVELLPVERWNPSDEEVERMQRQTEEAERKRRSIADGADGADDKPAPGAGPDIFTLDDNFEAQSQQLTPALDETTVAMIAAKVVDALLADPRFDIRPAGLVDREQLNRFRDENIEKLRATDRNFHANEPAPAVDHRTPEQKLVLLLDEVQELAEIMGQNGRKRASNYCHLIGNRIESGLK